MREPYTCRELGNQQEIEVRWTKGGGAATDLIEMYIAELLRLFPFQM